MEWWWRWPLVTATMTSVTRRWWSTRDSGGLRRIKRPTGPWWLWRCPGHWIVFLTREDTTQRSGTSSYYQGSWLSHTVAGLTITGSRPLLMWIFLFGEHDFVKHLCKYWSFILALWGPCWKARVSSRWTSTSGSTGQTADSSLTAARLRNLVKI